MRIGLNVFSLSLTDAPAVTAAVPELIITSGMRMQPLHEYSWQRIHLTCSPNSLFCWSGQGVAAGIRGPGGRSGGGRNNYSR